MRRECRLRRGSDFRRVRSRGRSWAHPLVVLYAAPHPQGTEATTRVGFVAGKRVGNAVVRNRAKRRAREAVRLRYERIPSGRDLVLILRSASARSSFDALDLAIERLLIKAGCLEESPAECVTSPSG